MQSRNEFGSDHYLDGPAGIFVPGDGFRSGIGHVIARFDGPLSGRLICLSLELLPLGHIEARLIAVGENDPLTF